MQQFGGFKPEIAKVRAFYRQGAIVAAATGGTWVGDLLLLPSCAAMKGYLHLY